MAPSLYFPFFKNILTTVAPFYPISIDYAVIIRAGTPPMVRAYPSLAEDKRGVCGPFSPLVPEAKLICLQHRCRTTYWSTSSKNMDCTGLKNTLAPD